ncbi:MAG: TIGR04086 family membrane protein, partial [Clostridiales bacterium]|nr:TIGR04086 family membrane protein [Clostridiales bacterium]
MSDKKLLTKAVIIGTACGLLVCVILLCVCSAVMLTSGLLPAEVTDYMMLAVVFFGALSGAFITARITKSAGLIVGLLTRF